MKPARDNSKWLEFLGVTPKEFSEITDIQSVVLLAREDVNREET